MKILLTPFLGSLSLIASLSTHAAIAYFDGPPFGIPLDFTLVEPLDLDHNGSTDFNFSAGPSLTTGSPDSSITPTFVSSVPGNAILGDGYYAAILPSGATIGASATGATWSTNDLNLATFGSGGFQIIITSNGLVTNLPTWSWGGPLVSAGSGFLGVRFQASDGLHYGWIHAAFQNGPVPLQNVPGSLPNGPVILDWAYETQPDTALLAGAAPVVPLLPPAVIRPGNLRLQWPSQPGAAYQVQFIPDVNALTWSNLDFTIIATAGVSAVDLPLTGLAGFYRVLQSN